MRGSMPRAKSKTEGPHPFDIYVGRQLRELRSFHGDSQEALGDRINVTFQQIQKYENGVNQLSHYRAYIITKKYKVPLSYFTDGYQEELPPEENDIPDIPVTTRGAARAAKLYTDIASPRVKKALLDVMSTIAKENGHGE